MVLSVVAAAAWGQQLQIPVERFPGMKLDVPSGEGALCKVCGEIRSIQEINVGRQAGPATPNPSVQHSSGEEWRVVGNVLSLPFGPGTDEGPRVGTAGTPEMTGLLVTAGIGATSALPPSACGDVPFTFVALTVESTRLPPSALVSV